MKALLHNMMIVATLNRSDFERLGVELVKLEERFFHISESRCGAPSHNNCLGISASLAINSMRGGGGHGCYIRRGNHNSFR